MDKEQTITKEQKIVSVVRDICGLNGRYFKNIKWEKNIEVCESCKRKTCDSINDKVIQPCSECRRMAMENREYMERKILTAHFECEGELDDKYKNATWMDIKKRNEDIEKTIRQAQWWINNFRRDWWAVLTGEAYTGKTISKNIMLRDLGKKGYSFHNITASGMYYEWYDCFSNSGSITMLRKKYFSRDILCIDGLGEQPDSEKFKQFFMDITNQRFTDNKSVVIVTKLKLKTKKEIEESGITKYIDKKKLSEKAVLMPFIEVV